MAVEIEPKRMGLAPPMSRDRIMGWCNHVENGQRSRHGAVDPRGPLRMICERARCYIVCNGIREKHDS